MMPSPHSLDCHLYTRFQIKKSLESLERDTTEGMATETDQTQSWDDVEAQRAPACKAEAERRATLSWNHLRVVCV